VDSLQLEEACARETARKQRQRENKSEKAEGRGTAATPRRIYRQQSANGQIREIR